ncbi:MAG: hypothetical protein FD173_1809 [Gallionellaceae bacterium]|nr:MAG: hypothetical protein FD173_1809 [Gallionellaceae bacterium]
MYFRIVEALLTINDVDMTVLRPSARIVDFAACRPIYQKTAPRPVELRLKAYNPMTYESAQNKEVKMEIGLRESDFGVWQE